MRINRDHKRYGKHAHDLRPLYTATVVHPDKFLTKTALKFETVEVVREFAVRVRMDGSDKRHSKHEHAFCPLLINPIY